MTVSILGAYTTKFGELWERSLTDLISEAGKAAIADAGLSKKQIDAVFVGNMLSGVLHNQEHLGALVTSVLGLGNCPAVKVEGACASGGLAVHNGYLAIQSGQYDNALVLGVEKMSDYKPEEVTYALMAAASEEEREAGLTFPGLYALLANAYFQKYQITEKQLAAVAVKNHYHATLNGKAHFKKAISIDDVLKSPGVADPLKLLDCSPISDGASALVLSRQNQPGTVTITASSVATDSLSLTGRADLTSLAATKAAARKAYQQAGVGVTEIGVMEIHDCFTIAEILAMEDLGVFAAGEAGRKIAAGLTSLTKQNKKYPVVNPSGGLKASGHPVGATGVKQVVELTNQLRSRAGKQQVDRANLALTHNVGGTGGTAAIHILQK